jgi:hypothetical protein
LTGPVDARAGVAPMDCPRCHLILNAAACMDAEEHRAPSAGDLSVCLGCGEFLRYDAAGAVEQLPLGDFVQLPTPIRRQMANMRELARRHRTN